jgi:flagellar motility protein MotE (MotC chaperone)
MGALTMKRMLMYVLVGAVLFGVSAGVSWWWQKNQRSQASAENTSGSGQSGAVSQSGEVTSESGGESSASGDRVAVRLPQSQQVEAAVQLLATLEKRREELRRQEEVLNARQKNLELLYNDIRAERAALDALRKQIAEEMRLLEEQLGKLDEKRQELLRQKEEVAERVKDFEGSLRLFEDNERKNLETLAERVSNMAPESAAKLFEHMANTGNLDTAVKLFSLVRESKAAKILEQMPPDLATQIIERVKNLKRTPPRPATKS